MMTFKKWVVRREMAGGDAIYGAASGDFQYWGAPETMNVSADKVQAIMRAKLTGPGSKKKGKK